jgi:hypothetical protein
MLVLLMEGIYEVRTSDGIESDNTYTKFHIDWAKHKVILRLLPQQFEKLQCRY